MKFNHFLEYGYLSLFSINWHYYNSEWHVAFLKYDYLEDDRSLFSVGCKDGSMWFVDVFWVKVLPKGDDND